MNPSSNRKNGQNSGQKVRQGVLFFSNPLAFHFLQPIASLFTWWSPGCFLLLSKTNIVGKYLSNAWYFSPRELMFLGQTPTNDSLPPLFQLGQLWSKVCTISQNSEGLAPVAHSGTGLINKLYWLLSSFFLTSPFLYWYFLGSTRKQTLYA